MSPQRHRYARPSELVEILAAKSHEGYMLGKRATGTESRRSESGEEVMVPFEQLSEASKDISRAAAAAMLDGLSALGVPVDALVRIVVDAETDVPAEPVNLTARPGDTIARFAGMLQAYEDLLTSAWSIIANVDNGTLGGHNQTEEWVTAAAGWRDRFHARGTA